MNQNESAIAVCGREHPSIVILLIVALCCVLSTLAGCVSLTHAGKAKTPPHVAAVKHGR